MKSKTSCCLCTNLSKLSISKLSNIDIKNSSLDSRFSIIETKICSLDEIQGTLKSMKLNFSKLEEEHNKCINTDFQTLESNMDSLGNLFDSVKERTTSNQKLINMNRNKKCFRNIYAPRGAKFRFIFSVEGNPVRRKGIKYIKWTTHWAQKVV